MMYYILFKNGKIITVTLEIAKALCEAANAPANVITLTNESTGGISLVVWAEIVYIGESRPI